jgi:hypothetical protein
VLGTDVACTAGQTINLGTAVPGKFSAGTTITCPSASSIAQICDSLSCPAACYAKGGDCVGGRCRCGMAWAGDTCSIRVEDFVAQLVAADAASKLEAVDDPNVSGEAPRGIAFTCDLPTASQSAHY